LVGQFRDLYQSLHRIAREDGGMFYSLYSRDLAYRQNVHAGIGEVLEPVMRTHFQGYRNVINTFIVKASGPQSDFVIHQDTTALDEFRHMALSLWIPLDDVSLENGGMSLVPKTHWLLPPYRTVAMPFAFQDIRETVRKYLQPVPMHAGEVLVFDGRTIHYSSPNRSGKDRVALVCGLFPEEAEFVTCWKDKTRPEQPMELFRHPHDYLLTYPQLFYHCHDRPVSGEVIGTVPDDFPPITNSEFEAFCATNGLPALDAVAPAMDSRCSMFGEPDGSNRWDG
ncbi:MAG: phytanoyl-CoA dioxygenase family protein, partial [Bacteroidota bacterium]